MINKKNKLISWVEKTTKKKIEKKNFNKNLFSSNILDSLDGIKLLIFLEKKLKIKIDKQFLENKNKQSINYIFKMIDKERKKMKYDKRDVINSLNKIGLKKNDIIFTQSNIALFGVFKPSANPCSFFFKTILKKLVQVGL